MSSCCYDHWHLYCNCSKMSADHPVIWCVPVVLNSGDPPSLLWGTLESLTSPWAAHTGTSPGHSHRAKGNPHPDKRYYAQAPPLHPVTATTPNPRHYPPVSANTSPITTVTFAITIANPMATTTNGHHRYFSDHRHHFPDHHRWSAARGRYLMIYFYFSWSSPLIDKTGFWMYSLFTSTTINKLKKQDVLPILADHLLIFIRKAQLYYWWVMVQCVQTYHVYVPRWTPNQVI